MHAIRTWCEYRKTTRRKSPFVKGNRTWIYVLSKTWSSGWVLGIIGQYVAIAGRLRKRKTKNGVKYVRAKEFALLRNTRNMEEKRIDCGIE